MLKGKTKFINIIFAHTTIGINFYKKILAKLVAPKPMKKSQKVLSGTFQLIVLFSAYLQLFLKGSHRRQ